MIMVAMALPIEKPRSSQPPQESNVIRVDFPQHPGQKALAEFLANGHEQFIKNIALSVIADVPEKELALFISMFERNHQRFMDLQAEMKGESTKALIDTFLHGDRM